MEKKQITNPEENLVAVISSRRIMVFQLFNRLIYKRLISETGHCYSRMYVRALAFYLQ
jgi:hypothetical protein